MTYHRVEYTTAKGKLSSAYYDEGKQDAWDIFLLMPVALSYDKQTRRYSETVMPKHSDSIPPQPGSQSRAEPTSRYRSGLGRRMLWATILFVVCIVVEIVFLSNY